MTQIATLKEIKDLPAESVILDKKQRAWQLLPTYPNNQLSWHCESMHHRPEHILVYFGPFTLLHRGVPES